LLASAASAEVLRQGFLTVEDPQRDTALWFPPAHSVETFAHGDTVTVGLLAVIANITPGHSPGGTTWSWQSCDASRCADMVYADSQTPVSDSRFRFSDGGRSAAFERGLDVIRSLSRDILLTPHPGASDLWSRLAARDAGDPDALFDRTACVRYAESAREQLMARLVRERSGGR
jgi:metallo-beta-lactamase class B